MKILFSLIHAFLIISQITTRGLKKMKMFKIVCSRKMQVILPFFWIVLKDIYPKNICAMSDFLSNIF